MPPGGILCCSAGGFRRITAILPPDTGVLVTEMRSHTGTVRLTDALTLRSGIDLSEDTSAGRSELLRLVEILHGQVRLRIETLPHEGGHPEPHAGGLSILYPSRPDIDFWLFCSQPLGDLQTIHDLGEGQRLQLGLRWSGRGYRHLHEHITLIVLIFGGYCTLEVPARSAAA